MPHAVVVQVRIEPGSDIGHRHAVLNDFVIPQVKALPGFQKGTWLNDGSGTGTCVVVFDTEDNARSAVEPLTPANGPAVISAGVYAVGRSRSRSLRAGRLRPGGGLMAEVVAGLLA